MQKIALLHIVFAFITIAAVAWLGVVNLVPSGDVTYIQNFRTRNPFISDLWPPEALEAIQNGVRPFKKDGVTFFIRPPRFFERAQLQIVLAHDNKLKPVLAIQTGAGAEDWQTIPWQSVLAGGSPARIYQATFALDPRWQNAQKRYIMKLSVPGLEKTSQEARAQKMSVRFLGSRVTVGNFWQLLQR